MIFVLDAFKDDFNGFLQKNAFWLALGLVGIILIVIALILIFGRKVKKTLKNLEKSRKSFYIIIHYNE